MRTQRLAELAGVSSQTVRYPERIGLLPEPPRTSAGYRDYPEDTVRLLRFVRRAKELGLPLDEIDELLAHERARCASVRELAERRVADLERRIADLTSMRDSQQSPSCSARVAVSSTASCGCGCRPWSAPNRAT